MLAVHTQIQQHRLFPNFMNNQTFSLISFPSFQPETELEPIQVGITGTIGRDSIGQHSRRLKIHYSLLGDLTQIVIPDPEAPTRQDDLWQTTCFEFFLGIQNSPSYWEFNLSPAGPWNVYRFDDYRQGMQEEPAFTALLFQVRRQRNILDLTLELDLSAISAVDQILDVAIATVIQHTDGRITYWAIAHPGPQADFHRRDSFLIKV